VSDLLITIITFTKKIARAIYCYSSVTVGLEFCISLCLFSLLFLQLCLRRVAYSLYISVTVCYGKAHLQYSVIFSALSAFIHCINIWHYTWGKHKFSKLIKFSYLNSPKSDNNCLINVVSFAHVALKKLNFQARPAELLTPAN